MVDDYYCSRRYCGCTPPPSPRLPVMTIGGGGLSRLWQKGKELLMIGHRKSIYRSSIIVGMVLRLLRVCVVFGLPFKACKTFACPPSIGCRGVFMEWLRVTASTKSKNRKYDIDNIFQERYPVGVIEYRYLVL